ncbi:MAG: hypothetical protein COW03_02145 [Cytophagales bacterium CG12_big_fil_rev_8_21_14_0_65_40_12]|nr:MAG: hypothetical protein COW03_02145 [Cytophagales bacterium CG12_big_fil_rev_8_21_14_0_65_40_12]
MDGKLNFLTKDLINEAAAKINEKGIPAKRVGTTYAVEINNKEYPYKLIVSEAAKLAGVNLEPSFFNSSRANRFKFEEEFGFRVVNKNYPITYWHLQMFLPQGRGGMEIDSIKLLYEEPPLIATGEWDNRQCIDFKTIMTIGDIVCVKEGKRILALCKVTSENFKDKELTEKYFNENFREVEVLEFYSGTTDFPQPQGTLQKATDPSTLTWNFINNWYTQLLVRKNMTKNTDVLKAKKQIILQGPPGTGKTYTAKDIAEEMIFGSVSSNKKQQKEKLESSDQFVLVQFHPSYSYEDFVRGIISKTNENGNVKYEVENKTLAKFARSAMSAKFATSLSEEDFIAAKYLDYLLMKQSLKESTHVPYYFNNNHEVRLLDVWYKNNYSGIGKLRYEIFRDGSWVMPTWIDIEESFTWENYNNPSTFDDDFIQSSLLAIQSDFIAFVDRLKQASINHVLIIDEINRANLPSVLGELIYALEYRNESVQSIYGIDGDNSLVLPDNLYIIGTMNTADRSVGHIDYAIKRRFAFVDVLPNIEIINNEKAKELFRLVSALFVKEDNTNSEHLASDFDYKDVQLGHSYFMIKEGSVEDQTEELKMRLQYEILPILNEYIKDGILLESAKDKLKEISGFGF